MHGMFLNCEAVSKLNLSSFNTNKVTDMGSMFQNCKALKRLNLSNFNTKNVLNVTQMFDSCEALISLDISNFNTQKIKNMKNMFYNCLELTSLDVTSFTTNLVEDFTHMFGNCKQLTSLDLSSFRTNGLKKSISLYSTFFTLCTSMKYLDLSNWDFSMITFSEDNLDNLKSLEHLKLSNAIYSKNTMASLFSGLNTIISLNLSNFKAPNVVNMNNMFSNSKKLKTLDLTNFYTNKVTTMESMFEGCKALTSLDISSFDTSLVTIYQSMFYNLPSLSYLKLNFNLNKINDKKSMNVFNLTKEYDYCIFNVNNMIKFYNTIRTSIDTIRDCSMRCYDDLYVLDTETNECVLFDCRSNISYPYKYNYKCYSKCPARTYLASNITNLCLDLNCNNYYDFEQNNCIDEIPIGHYINDSIEKTIDKCHSDCKYCYGKPIFIHKNCKACYSDKFLYFGNCIDKCPYGYYIDENDSSMKICSCSEKCKECSAESYDLDLCISCNEGYLPVLINNSNISVYQKYYDCIKNDTINQNQLSFLVLPASLYAFH